MIGLMSSVISHTEYLANTSGLKEVSLEKRKCQRWIDQGAMQALPIYQRKIVIKLALLRWRLNRLHDKTNWRTMLNKTLSTWIYWQSVIACSVR